MSGHSKWATIHRKKDAIDAQRGKIFQKLAKELYVAAKTGIPDPEQNPNLRMVVEKARGENMPKDNIQHAIDKAKGSSENENYESVFYEGYGPNGLAIMVDCLTDNRNRTASFIRATFTKRGGNLGTDGSVSYLFNRKGIIVIPNKYDEDEIMMNCLDNGALDFISNDENYEIYTTPEDFLKVKESLEKLGISEFITSEVTYIASSYITLDAEAKEKALGLIETLEDNDDVQNVYHNLDY